MKIGIVFVPGKKKVKKFLLLKCDECQKIFTTYREKSYYDKKFHFCSHECVSKSFKTDGKLRLQSETTCLEKHGVKCVLQIKHIHENGIIAANSPEARIKAKRTCLENHGAEHPMHSPEIKEKVKKTCLEKYGVSSPFIIPEVHKKAVILSHTPEARIKAKETCIKNHGVESPLQSPVIMEKVKKTCLEKYGTENALISDYGKQKTKITNLRLYGSENASCSEHVKEKIKQTVLKKYNVECTLQVPEIREKIKTTNINRYGFPYVTQNSEISSRAAKTRNNSQTLIHWKTGKELVCVGSYEVAFVNWCNVNQIDFDWQITHKTPFLTPEGYQSVYIIDAFIKSGKFSNTWIEIKGWFKDENAKAKWIWFHSEHPNDSQLWNQPRLKELGIL